MFVLNRAGIELRASGIVGTIAPGPRSTLDERCRAMLGGSERAEPQGSEPPMLVGALPFDPDGGEFLYRPAVIRRGKAAACDGAGASGHSTNTADALPALIAGRDMVETPSAAEYARMVAKALERIAAAPGESHAENLQKVVLARQVIVQAADDIDFTRLLRELERDPQVTAYRVDLDPVSGRGDHLLIGATPELLIAREGLAIRSEPLAGSIARGRNPAQDRERAETLLASAKDQREHAITVEYILDLLAPFCAQLTTPGGTGLRSTASMWHLGTRIEGILKGEDSPSAAGLAALLHPTPAVGGYPRGPALEAIRELENNDRGYYAGAVGYVDAKGDGEWHVALRCAELVGSRLVLHAGAGIVTGSVPEDEARETAAKFRAMLRALGIADGQPLAERVL